MNMILNFKKQTKRKCLPEIKSGRKKRTASFHRKPRVKIGTTTTRALGRARKARNVCAGGKTECQAAN